MWDRRHHHALQQLDGGGGDCRGQGGWEDSITRRFLMCNLLNSLLPKKRLLPLAIPFFPNTTAPPRSHSTLFCFAKSLLFSNNDACRQLERFWNVPTGNHNIPLRIPQAIKRSVSKPVQDHPGAESVHVGFRLREDRSLMRVHITKQRLGIYPTNHLPFRSTTISLRYFHPNRNTQKDIRSS